MTEYREGQRVELAYTNDPYTRLEPGAVGTVTRVTTAQGLRTVHVRWDSGSELAMLVDEGDKVRVVPPARTPEQEEADRAADRYERHVTKEPNL